jgi:hypothetical protein
VAETEEEIIEEEEEEELESIQNDFNVGDNGLS